MYFNFGYTNLKTVSMIDTKKKYFRTTYES